MRNEFGQTWWGKHWLNSLAAVDCENRLPRGRTYANNGSVKTFDINRNKINAEVQGSHLYTISITVPVFTDSQQQTLLRDISIDSQVLAKLMRRELDSHVLQIATAHGIKVFPEKWDDFDMRCSCPDWAVPCKHLAAVIYKVSREIDKNPFLVFLMRDFDLTANLEKLGLKFEESLKIVIPRLVDFAAVTVDENAKDDRTTNETTGRRLLSEVFDTLDFARIEDLRETLPRLLTAKPLFFENGDFRELYQKAVREISKNAKSYFVRIEETRQNRKSLEIENSRRTKNAKTTKTPPAASPTIRADERISFVINEKHEIVSLEAGNCRNFDELLTALEAVESDDLRFFGDETKILHIVYLFALNLLEKGAIVPQILRVADDEIFVRWIPAFLNGAVGKICADLSETFAHQTITLKTNKREFYFDRAESFKTLCALFLTYFVKRWNGIAANWKYTVKLEESGAVFFVGETRKFTGQSDLEAMQIWTSRFHLVHKTFVPVLKIVEIGVDENVFGVEISVENKLKPLDAPVKLAKFVTDKKFASQKFELLKDLTLLAEHFPALEAVIRTNGAAKPRFSSDEFANVFFEVLPVMRLFGINLILPKALKSLVKPDAAMRIKKKAAEAGESFLRLDDLLSFDWRVSIGDGGENLTENEFRKLVKGLSGIVKLRGQYVYLNENELSKLYENLRKTPKLDSKDLLRATLAEEYRGVPITINDEIKGLLENLRRTPEVELPQALTATLRPYQKRGYEWLYKNTRLGFGSLIADDMGLGKTLQVITMILKFKEQGELENRKCLVIAPTSLLSNWRKEIEKFAPTLSVNIYHGANRDLKANAADIVLTSYGTIRANKNTGGDVEILKKTKWFAVVIDEAQNIKNTATDQTKAVKSLKAETFIAMSGTPVENRLSEFWSIFDFANRGYLGSLTKFAEEFARPIQNKRDQTALEKFKKATAPFMLRRLKSDKSIISDLPEKLESDVFCSLTKEQAAVYQNTVRAAMKTIEGASKENHFERQGLVLQMITALKQICNHPAQYLKKGEITPELSGKSSVTLNLLENILANNEKTLIFTQYREMGEMLVKFINGKFGDDFGFETLFLHGGCSRKKRDEMVESFQNEASAKVFVLSLKAGGTGLNLTGASNVIHYDLWWNPAVEAQATDRAYRIGQKKNVMVSRLITQGTFEEKINEMLRGKKELADLTVGAGENWIGNLSNKELREIFAIS